MGYKFVIKILEGEADKFFQEEEGLVNKTSGWEPRIELRIKGNEMIIEPQDQRSRSQYPEYITKLLKRAYEQFAHFSFRREEGYYPNPQLNELFFYYVLFRDAIERAKENGQDILGEQWNRNRFLKQFREYPLSDETLKKMFEEGLKIRYLKNERASEGICSPPTSSNPLVIRIGCDGPKEEQDSTLVHEIIEAYGFFVGSGGSIAVPCYNPYSALRNYHRLVGDLEKELCEFGFHRTIRRFEEDYKASSVVL